VVRVIPERGAVIQTAGALVQRVGAMAAWETGIMVNLADKPNSVLTAGRLDVSCSLVW